MPSVKLYKGPKTTANAVNYQCATFDFENATADLDYVIDNQATGTMPTTGEELKQIRFHVSLAGINFLSGYNEDSNSNQNLVLPPKYDTGHGNIAYPYDISAAETVPIGEKPADWELRYMDKYFTRSGSSFGNTYYYNYSSAGVARSGVFYPDWNAETQYYQVPNFAQIFYTDATGFFGVSRSLNLIGETSVRETVRVLYNRRPYGSGNFYPGEFWWKANGAFGTQLFTQSLTTSKKVMIEMTSSQANPMNTYQSRLLVQMIKFDYEEETYTGIVVITLSADGLAQQAQITALSEAFWKAEITPANGGPSSSVQGGQGTFDGTSDNRGDRTGSTALAISNEWLSNNSVISGGYNNYYLPVGAGATAFKQMVSSLWNPSVFEGFQNMMYNPIDSIVCCHQLPAILINSALPTNPEYDKIKAAGVTLSEAEVAKFSVWNAVSHIGSVDITEYTGSFADYTNCSIYIHLPYVGTKEIDTAAAMNGWLSVDYLTDLYSGDCTAFVTVEDRFTNRQIRYEWKGHCGKDVPLRQKVPVGTHVAASVGQAAIGIAVGAAGGALAGAMASSLLPVGGQGKTTVTAQNAYRQSVGSNIAQSAVQSAGGIATAATQAELSGQNTSSNNASGGAVTSPSNTQCFLIITRPQWSNPDLYANQKAYPSDISGTIAGDGFSGFLQTQTIKLNGITATDEERYEIATRMNSGVYV